MKNGLWNKFRTLLGEIAEKFRASQQKPIEQSKFVDLAPTEKADKDGVYRDALAFATNNRQVRNIALTGPYGSGKSSIIKSFLKVYKRPALQISLAAFFPDTTATTSGASRQEIERSILQQMLYGADANRLPLSRFKRITSPGKASLFKSLYIALGIFACWHILQERAHIISGDFFLPLSFSNWLNLSSFLFGTSFFWAIIHHIYVSSFGLSLKSVSLKDIEITPIPATQESILNRHLDEIIYFFQSTKYDLVVIEDLDRFDNADIFVTLREINSLVNANAGVHRVVRFVYALRDDIFVSMDRTKFFEFIIPVIPIINSSNSIDKVLEQGQRLSLNDRLDRQFLREVSRYLNDLRLIQNIFNEYAIYVANLETGDEKILDPNKLLAVLIYKNVFPKDFESLHRGKGGLAEILDLRERFVADVETKYKMELVKFEKQVDATSRLVPQDLHQLRRIYAMALVEKLPSGTTQVGLDGNPTIDLSALSKHEQFEQVIAADRIHHRNLHGHVGRLDLSGFESGVDSVRTYQQRKLEIEQKSAEHVNVCLARIAGLRENLANVRIAKFNELIRLNAIEAEDKFSAFGDNAALVRFLVFEGYLDDTYYQYTSLFHSGRLSANDNKFLIQIRGFANPDPGFQIDNPKEVIAAMRDDDFRREYVLNVKIVDTLLGGSTAYADKSAKLFGYIAAEFDQCQVFLDEYYARGAEVSALLFGLAKAWEGFLPAALASTKNISHVAQIVAHLPVEALEAASADHAELSEFVSRNLPQVLVAGPSLEPKRLKYLNVEVDDLAAAADFAGVTQFLVAEGLYRLTPDNILFALQSTAGADDASPMRTQNYTTILNVDDPALLSRIDRDFAGYVRHVLLELEENTLESVPAILRVIAHQELELGDIREFLDRQEALLPSLEQIPERLHATVFQLAKIEPSWDNCLAFLTSEAFDEESLTGYLNTDFVIDALSTQGVPDADAASSLRSYLIENDALTDDAYRLFTRQLPKQFKEFPEGLGRSKVLILIKGRRIAFSPDSFESLADDDELQLLFAANNITEFLNGGDLGVDDNFREALLREDIADQDRHAIIGTMDVPSLAGLPARAAVLGPIVHRTGIDVAKWDAGAVRAIILHSKPVAVQIALLNKSAPILSNESVREILAGLPRPYSEITTGYHTPRLQKIAENIELANWLDARGIISSWSDTFFGDEIRLNLFRR